MLHAWFMCGFATALWKINVLHYNFSNKTILLNMCSNVCIYMCIYIVCTNNNCQVISFSSTSYKKKEKKYYDYIQRHNKLPNCCKSGAFLIFILQYYFAISLYLNTWIQNYEWNARMNSRLGMFVPFHLHNKKANRMN